MSQIKQAILQFQDIGKSFFGIPVLQEISFSVERGTVVGLVGENGAGKSTLMNILEGQLHPDTGSLILEGASFSPASPSDALEAGIAVVHQELNLFTNLTVAENLFLSDFPTRTALLFSWLDRKELRHRSSELLSRLGLRLDPNQLVERLSSGQRQLVEIARALRGPSRIVVLDEPTTSLSQPETRMVFNIVRGLRDSGATVIYISHNLGDVLRLCDRIVVLRDGRIQAVGSRQEFSISSLIQLMVGRTLERFYPQRKTKVRNKKLLEVRNLSRTGALENISLTLHSGEILGVSGLMGSGRTELARALFGLDSFQKGEIIVRGNPIPRPNPRLSVKLGMAFVTEDRSREGLLPEASVEDNLGIATWSNFGSRLFGILRTREFRKRHSDLIRALDIHCQSEQQEVRTLSGGNQQKIVFAKWLLANPEILILDEPTRGIDIGAKYDLYRKICELADRGAGILWISSELEELAGLCNRILVLTNGEVETVVEGDEFSRDQVLRSAFGEERLQ